MPIELYPFRYRDPLNGRWIRSRYKAERHVIAEMHDEWGWEITGPPDVSRGYYGRGFSPYRVTPAADLKRLEEAPPQINPHLTQPPAIDANRRFLACLLLRWYVTYCARRRRYAQVEGAARLYREVKRAAART